MICNKSLFGPAGKHGKKRYHQSNQNNQSFPQSIEWNVSRESRRQQAKLKALEKTLKCKKSKK